MPKKILIAEPNIYLSEAIVGILAAFGYDVVGSTSNLAEVSSLAREQEPDLLLIDFEMSRQIDIATVKAQFPEMKVVASLWHESIDLFAEVASTIGMDGYCCKYCSRDNLLKSIKALLP